jgi:hypothetical protein
MLLDEDPGTVCAVFFLFYLQYGILNLLTPPADPPHHRKFQHPPG